MIKLVLTFILLVVSAYFSNELFIVCKPEVDCNPPLYSYLSGIIFLIILVYISICLLYAIFLKSKKRGKK